MSLDSHEGLHYTVSDIEKPSASLDPGRCRDTNGDGESMIVFLSFPGRDESYQRVVRTLQERGLVVLTNFDRVKLEGASQKTDLRLARIRRSDAYVFFAPETKDQWSPLRQVEFGYALGAEIPVAFVGTPFNSLHRYGDVFDDIDEFLDWWYSDEYCDVVSKWFPDGTGTSAVA
jgi:hypothetical protein